MNGDTVFLLVPEIAAHYAVSERVVQRRIEEKKEVLEATKASQEQLVQLFSSGRIKGISPQGVWLVPKQNVGRIVWRRTAGRPPKQKQQ